MLLFAEWEGAGKGNARQKNGYDTAIDTRICRRAATSKEAQRVDLTAELKPECRRHTENPHRLATMATGKWGRERGRRVGVSAHRGRKFVISQILVHCRDPGVPRPWVWGAGEGRDSFLTHV